MDSSACKLPMATSNKWGQSPCCPGATVTLDLIRTSTEGGPQTVFTCNQCQKIHVHQPKFKE